MTNNDETILSDLKEVVESLKNKFQFHKAHELLEKSAKLYPENLWIKAQAAVCAFQNKCILSDYRLEKTITILENSDPDIYPVDDKDKQKIILACAEKALKTSNYSDTEKLLSKLKQYDLSQDEQDNIFYSLYTAFDSLFQEDKEQALAVLENFMGDKIELIENAFNNKTGIGLSGGGFRASLYHIGILACLAELDLLRHIEVISTVSGGSIVGAHYYLELKHLLESKADDEITREDYINIIKNIQEDFLKGVQENIRNCAISDIGVNLKMIFSEKYSRSHRLGELYESMIYAKVKDGHKPGQPRYMKDLLIHPKDESRNFNPEQSNWRRKAKVPVILINATSLNTGHNWHFTARFMGEPPGLLEDRAVDKNSRYRRVRYEDAPAEELENYRLGYAVAASACVPGAFPPLTIEGLYPEKIVRLVDGGVHDNQGMEGLLDENCKTIYCSDASGQMHDLDIPSDFITSVLLRSSSIAMDRLREEQFQEINAKFKDDRFKFFHMKKDFPVNSQNWEGCSYSSPIQGTQKDLPYGIALEIQEKIAGIRTDLDSFSEVEAYALMTSGYLTAKKYMNNDTNQDNDIKWKFLELSPFMQTKASSSSEYKNLNKQLEAAASPVFKLLKLEPILKYLTLAGLTVLAIIIIKYIGANWEKTFSISVRGIFLILGFIAIPFIASRIGKILPFTRHKKYSKKINKMLKNLKTLFPLKSARNIARDIFIALIGSFIAKIYLAVFNDLFLKHGKIKSLKK
ncbi:Patatin-like phospholipase [Desulfonema limicola]|uniref:Patatin-like phospholipase n=1 Tax=Desulfonema limicola TaxID=45656 RepID=A0A975B8L9_9BACT|nr:patatin-like phospholipase family protein [Desulfonema limicola]QTA80687.1 Patatin-like phospholipase [Desulfonema limicola]